MELKHQGIQATMFKLKLLIVPYGIETVSFCIRVSKTVLLIVPYGIETF